MLTINLKLTGKTALTILSFLKEFEDDMKGDPMCAELYNCVLEYEKQALENITEEVLDEVIDETKILRLLDQVPPSKQEVNQINCYHKKLYVNTRYTQKTIQCGYCGLIMPDYEQLQKTVMRLSSKVFVYNNSDEKNLKMRIYTSQLNNDSVDFDKLITDLIYIVNNNGKTTKYLFFNNNTQKLRTDNTVMDWAIAYKNLVSLINYRTNSRKD